MSHFLGKSYGIGLHKYNPAQLPGAVFLDVADAQYNPLNPEEIVAGIHPASRPGTYGVAKYLLRDNAVLAEVTTEYKWDSGLEPYIDVEEGLLYVATGTGVVEVRDMETLQLQRELTLPVEGITSTALDSQGRLWLISNPKRGGDGGLYVLEGSESVERVRQYSIPTSLDSMRITPWGKKLLVADYGRHTVECISEEGESLGSLHFPYVSGAKWTLDERVLISSGKYDKHTFLLLITGALHNAVESGWFGYVMDYGTLASNRADAFYLDRVLIQWYLGFSEISLPLPKRAPYVVRVGSGEFGAGELVKEQGFAAFTPIPVFNEGYVVVRPKDVELALEVLVPHHHIIAPKPDLAWDEVARFRGMCEVCVPGVYRVRATSKAAVEVYAICKP